MGTFEVAGPVAYHSELLEGWSYAVPLAPRCVIAHPRDGIPLHEAMALGGDPIRRFARGACARGLYRIDAVAFDSIECASAPRAIPGDFESLISVSAALPGPPPEPRLIPRPALVLG